MDCDHIGRLFLIYYFSHNLISKYKSNVCTQQVAAFRATLEEITDSSLLLHMVDVRCVNILANRLFAELCASGYSSEVIECASSS